MRARSCISLGTPCRRIHRVFLVVCSEFVAHSANLIAQSPHSFQSIQFWSCIPIVDLDSNIISNADGHRYAIKLRHAGVSPRALALGVQVRDYKRLWILVIIRLEHQIRGPIQSKSLYEEMFIRNATLLVFWCMYDTTLALQRQPITSMILNYLNIFSIDTAVTQLD